MRLFERQRTDEILKRVVANEIIAIKCIGDKEVVSQFIKNSDEMMLLIGDFKGWYKARKTVLKYILEELESE